MVRATLLCNSIGSIHSGPEMLTANPVANLIWRGNYECPAIAPMVLGLGHPTIACENQCSSLCRRCAPVELILSAPHLRQSHGNAAQALVYHLGAQVIRVRTKIDPGKITTMNYRKLSEISRVFAALCSIPETRLNKFTGDCVCCTIDMENQYKRAHYSTNGRKEKMKTEEMSTMKWEKRQRRMNRQ